MHRPARLWHRTPEHGQSRPPEAKLSPRRTPTKPPLNLNGCWSGSLIDERSGSGTGFLFFVQNGTVLGEGTEAEIDVKSIGIDFGLKGLEGKANSEKFELGLDFKRCKQTFHGTIDNDGHLTGSYHLTKKCFSEVLKGTYDYKFDASGTSCPPIE